MVLPVLMRLCRIEFNTVGGMLEMGKNLIKQKTQVTVNVSLVVAWE